MNYEKTMDNLIQNLMNQFQLSKEYQNFLDFLLKASDFTEQVTEDAIFKKFRKYLDEEME